MRWHLRAPQDWKGRPLHNISSWLRFVEKVSSGERSTGFSACGAGRHQNLGAPRDFQFYIPGAGLKQNDFADDRLGDRKLDRTQAIDEYWSNQGARKENIEHPTSN